MPIELRRVALLCIGAFLAGSGTTLALVGAFVVPSGAPLATHLTVAALPVVTLGLALLLGAVLLDRERLRRSSPSNRPSLRADGRHAPDHQR